MKGAADDYIFRFDAPVEPVILGGELALHGWLVQREDKSIGGIRVLVRRSFRKAESVPARRKRKRPEIAAAFPNLTNAEDSGFLFELQLGFGRNQLVFQVKDENRKWRTFAQASIFAVPLGVLNSLGLTNLRQFLIFYFAQFLAGRSEQKLSLGEASPTAQGQGLRTKRVELFATAKSNLFIIEIGELVAAGFRELGLQAQLHLDKVPEQNPGAEVVQIVVTPHEYYNLFLTEKFSRDCCEELTRNVYLLCTEQPETGWFQGNLHWAAHARAVADINPLGVAAYRRRAINAHHLQLGFDPMLAGDARHPHEKRRYDITFLGSMTKRRDQFFAQHGDFFAAHNCHLRLVPLGFAKTKTTRSYLSAAERNALLSDSRILLNLHYSEQRYFEWHRMLLALANGCCVITETCNDHGPLVPGEHFIMVEPEYLIPACEYYLAHPRECEAIGQTGRQFVETELRQARGCRAFLEEIESGGASPLPFAAPAAPLPGELKRHLSRHTIQLLGDALRRDLRREPPAKETEDIELRPATVDQRLRDPIVMKREAYRLRLAQQEEARERGDSVAEFHDNDAYARSATPTLSVLITLYNYAQHIDECVASATRAAERLGQPAEIVIVNDASSDDSLGCALRCQRASILPVRIVDKRFNTGLADARNTALHFARAPYVFMLDADNLVYPEAFRQLLTVISSGEYAAAYSLLCRFRGSPQNRIGLLSYFDWDPQILVQYPYIDAMAMFRRDVLLSLGGYDNELSQIGWFGWEDYDMWLRFAQRDLRVGFVANTLCLYRHHETSMINSTNLFEMELVRHFIERFGDLLDRFERRATVFGVERSKLMELGETVAAAR
ncbi:MAG: glycosyltransferase [Chthoniobacterales bacterium]